MVRECRPPSVKDAGHANPCAKAFGVGCNCHHRLRRRFEQKAIDGLLVPVGDAGNLSGQREDDVEIFHRQQILCPCRHPVARSGTLTFRAVPVLARVISDVLVIAFGACGHMPAERLGSAGLNGGHHFELAEADMSLIDPPPSRAMGAEDVSDLQLKLTQLTSTYPGR